MSDRKFDKLAIAKMHGESAIKMMATGCSPFSTHLPVMACSEIVATIAKQRGVALPLDLTYLIREERRAEWHRAEVKAYNFFKHADRDAEEVMGPEDIVRIEQLNDLMMISNITHLHRLGSPMNSAYDGYSATIALLYPGMIDWDALDAKHPRFRAAREQLGQVSRPVIMQAIRGALYRAGLLPSL